MKHAYMLLAALISTNALAQPVIERKSVDQLTTSEVQSLRKAVEMMKSRNPPAGHAPDFADKDYLRSWDFWSKVHGTAVAPTGAEQKKYFAQCEHGDLFLAWHRVYLYYFERVLQQAVNDPDLRVPYWNYTAGPHKSTSMPEIFRVKTYKPTGAATPTPNPLFASLRAKSVNDGNAYDSASTSTYTALTDDAFDVFQQDLFQTPHGSMHCDTAGSCPTPLMGTPARAAEDAIFWPHHVNMDRLWNCWSTRYGKAGRIESVQGDTRTFYFADENGDWKTFNAAQLLDAADTMKAHYDEETDCAEQPLPPIDAAASSKHMDVMVASKAETTPTAVSATGAKLTLKFAPPAAASAEFEHARKQPKRVLLSVTLSYAQAPEASYDVHASVGAGPTVRIGRISFFGAGGHPGQTHAEHEKPRRFDVTRLFSEGVPIDGNLAISLKPVQVAEPPAAAVVDKAALQVTAAAVVLER